MVTTLNSAVKAQPQPVQAGKQHRNEHGVLLETGRDAIWLRPAPSGYVISDPVYIIEVKPVSSVRNRTSPADFHRLGHPPGGKARYRVLIELMAEHPLTSIEMEESGTEYELELVHRWVNASELYPPCRECEEQPKLPGGTLCRNCLDDHQTGGSGPSPDSALSSLLLAGRDAVDYLMRYGQPGRGD